MRSSTREMKNLAAEGPVAEKVFYCRQFLKHELANNNENDLNNKSSPKDVITLLMLKGSSAPTFKLLK